MGSNNPLSRRLAAKLFGSAPGKRGAQKPAFATRPLRIERFEERVLLEHQHDSGPAGGPLWQWRPGDPPQVLTVVTNAGNTLSQGAVLPAPPATHHPIQRRGKNRPDHPECNPDHPHRLRRQRHHRRLGLRRRQRCSQPKPGGRPLPNHAAERQLHAHRGDDPGGHQRQRPEPTLHLEFPTGSGRHGVGGGPAAGDAASPASCSRISRRSTFTSPIRWTRPRRRTRSCIS